jgi:uncharacterized Zn-binding protein involved in type VI secretion
MPPAARVNDATLHPGVISPPGIPMVLIMGSPAAVVGTIHTCLLLTPSGNPAHPPTPFAQGSRSVFIGGSPALRVGDKSSCGSPIVTGAAMVLIG